MRRLSTTLAVLATVLTSAIAVAQTRPVTPPRPNRAGQPTPANRDSQPPRVRGAGPAGPHAGSYGGPAGTLLRMREQLELTDEQVKQLETLQTAPRSQPNEAEILRARADLMDATGSDVNLEKARAAFDRMNRVRTDAQIAQLKSRQDLRNVLTVAQRAKFDAFSANVRDRRGGAMRDRSMPRMGKSRGPQMRGQRPGRERDQFGPGMRNGRGPMGPPDGGRGFQRGRRPDMGPGMGPGMGPDMGPGMGQGMRPGMGQRVRPPASPVPPADTLR